ncbi:MAG: laminin B domain-containing protein, partial [bacterium]
MRRYFILAAILFSTSGYLFAQDITSQFDTDDEDWRAVNNNMSIPTYFATGGNPGGYISITDNRSGIAWYWQAPAKFLGDVSSAYGGSLSFDLKQSLTINQFDGIDIILEGGGLTLVFNTPRNPGTAWTSYSVSLIETAGWTKTTLTGPPPTQAEMLSVLSSLTKLQIRGEYSSSTSGDRTDLDNVVLAYNPFIANAGPDRAINSGQSVTLGGTPTANGGTAPYSYSWSPADDLDNPNIANPTASPSSTTIYSVTVTDANNVTSMDVVVVAVNGNTLQCITSFFDSGNEGWVVAGDAQGGSVTPDYFASGGNPGGYISARDDVTGGVWYWQAPAKFLGNVSCSYGGVLSFDLRQSSTTSQFNAADIILQSSGLTLVFNTPNNPGTAWTSYSILLSETAGWRKTTLTGPPPTQTEMMAVLSSLQKLQIRGEYRSGADRGDLDNVVFTCNPSLTATVSGDATICAGGSAII